MRTVLFHRDFRRFSGGHLKVWHYFNHVRHLRDHRPEIHFSRETRWDASNPWLPLRDGGSEPGARRQPDVLFVAGLDWLMLDPRHARSSSIPIINLVQHVRHADRGDPRYRFLGYKAIRICVSDEVASAIAASRRANGPVRVIPNGIDRDAFPSCVNQSARHCDILIAALKNPALGLQVKRRLDGPGRRIALLDTELPRPEFLGRLNQARITVFLPNPVEGFYLPALEGMALGTIVVCPDCVGNRSFCLPGYNCLRPGYAPDRIVEAVEAALRLPEASAAKLLSNARLTVARHDLAEERRAFLRILDHVNELW